MAPRGTAHKLLSAVLRLGELAFAAIVLGILGHFSYLITIQQVHADERIVYTMVVAGIALCFSLFFCPPFDALSLSFPFDFILFIMWLVAFCLLSTRSGHAHCSSRWYNDYWGYYWGRFGRFGPIGAVDINRAGCAPWRTVLAFSFIASMTHLLSAFLGIYIFRKYVRVKDTVQEVKVHACKLSRSVPKDHHVQNGQNGDNVAVSPPVHQTQPEV